ncbi:MAG: hypothetical protein IJG40_16375 [Oscillospiraceae bacterium]|nr:hypothetical protein [Oscillospiraceae bacterium]
MEKAAKRLRILAIFTFFLSPLFSWGSVTATDETAVFASLSRMIWYSGSALQIFIAMLVLFIPMLISFFCAQHERFIKATETGLQDLHDRRLRRALSWSNGNDAKQRA